MAENVIFNNQGNTPDQNDPNTQQGAPVAQATEQQPPGNAPVDSTASGPDIQDGDSGVPPPSGIGAILGKSSLKKIFIGISVVVILVIVLILFLPKGSSQKDVALVWWGLWEDANTMQPLIDDFEKHNPHIKIAYSKHDPQRFRDTVLTRISSGTGPDILLFHNTWTPILSKILAPLPQDVISASDFIKQYYPVSQNDLIQNGAIYGVPLGVDSIALYINTDLLSAAGLSVPKDWNQFKDAAKKLTVRDKDTNRIKVAGAAIGTYNNVNHAPDILSLMFLQQGVNLKKISASIDNLTAALTFYTAFSSGKDAVWDNTMDNSLLEFARGNVAMYFGFSWDYFIIEQYKKSNNFKYAIYPVPSLVENRGITIASYWAEGVSVRSKYQKEAMRFMNYLTQKQTLQRLYSEASKTRLFGEPYPRVDMADTLKDNSIAYPFISGMGNAGSSYFASNTYDGDTGLNKRANTYLENAINSIVKQGASPESAVQTLLEGITKVLQENGINQ